MRLLAPRWMVVCLFLLVACSRAHAAAASWVELRSAHFTVVTNAGEKQGREVVDQFERMRWVFRALFPGASLDPATPIVVVATKGEQEFRPLEPPAYLAKGQLKIAGYFLRATDKNYVLVRLDGVAGNPWTTVYHEYTHLEIGEAVRWMPLWLNEGLAEFFQNTQIEPKAAWLGQVNTAQLTYLRRNRLIPLPTLLRVDSQSPYYHEEQKGSMFYAESWALTHYLESMDAAQHTNHVGEYLRRVSRHEDPVRAAAESFGDLAQMQRALEGYIGRGSWQSFRVAIDPATFDEGTVAVRPLSAAQADAVRADLLAHNDRGNEARAIVKTVLEAEPENVLAHETMGYIALQQGDPVEARQWYERAVRLDSQNYLAQYYFAMLSDTEGAGSSEVEKSFRAAIRLNPRFVPAYDGLAEYYRARGERLEDARMLETVAMQLEPGNQTYRLDAAQVLAAEQRYDEAVGLLHAAAADGSPQDSSLVAAEIRQIRGLQAQVQRDQQQAAEYEVRLKQYMAAVAEARRVPEPQHPTEKPHGRMRIARGVIHQVTCSQPVVMQFRLENRQHKLSLYTNDWYRTTYEVANFMPKGEIHPCEDLEGLKAEVEYFRTADPSVDGQIVAILLFK